MQSLIFQLPDSKFYWTGYHKTRLFIPHVEKFKYYCCVLDVNVQKYFSTFEHLFFINHFYLFPHKDFIGANFTWSKRKFQNRFIRLQHIWRQVILSFKHCRWNDESNDLHLWNIYRELSFYFSYKIVAR